MHQKHRQAIFWPRRVGRATLDVSLSHTIYFVGRAPPSLGRLYLTYLRLSQQSPK